MYQYTTPTVTITIPTDYDVDNITDLLITLEKGDITLTKGMNDVTFDSTNNAIVLTLTQEDTGSFTEGMLKIQAHLKIGSTVYATQIMRVQMNYNLHQAEL